MIIRDLLENPNKKKRNSESDITFSPTSIEKTTVNENTNIIVSSQEVLERHRKNHNKDCFNLCHFLSCFVLLFGGGTRTTG